MASLFQISLGILFTRMSRCEVQYEYGLRQHRSKRLEKRPESFITREGKEIRVEKKTAQLNDIVLREGHVSG